MDDLDEEQVSDQDQHEQTRTGIEPQEEAMQEELCDELCDELPNFDDSMFVQSPKEDKRTEARVRTPLSVRCGRQIPLEGRREQLVQEQQTDPTLWDCRQKAAKDVGEFSYTQSGVLVRTWKDGDRPSVQELVMPRPYREKILRMAHSSPFAGHFG